VISSIYETHFPSAQGFRKKEFSEEGNPRKEIMEERPKIPITRLPIHFDITIGKILAILAANTLIALFIVAIHPGARFMVSLIYSQCIGISIAAGVIAAANLFTIRRMGAQVALIVVTVIVGAIVGVAVGTAAARYLRMDVGVSVPPDMQFKYYLSNLLYALLFGATVSYVFISLQKLSDERIKRLEVEKNAVLTEIKLLQSQMEPHFLFNTLSTVLSLIDSDPEKAKRMLESFTSFLRTSLVRARSETVTLSQEMDVVQNYLHLFAVRMGDRLHYTIDIPDSLRDFRLPPLLLQPLVENAVKHGLEPSVRGGDIVIRVSREGDTVRLTVSDSGTGMNESSPGNGMSLHNIRRRLDLLYHGRGMMTFEENEPSGVRVVIEIPYEIDSRHHS
jgi:signal transduction histidine kinase